MKKYTKSVFLFAAAVMLTSAGAAQAQNSKSGMKKMDRAEQIQMQEKMAKLHGDAASCLKDNNKTVEACKTDMMKNCSMDKAHCNMMGSMMSGDTSMMDHSTGTHDMHGEKKKTTK